MLDSKLFILTNFYEAKIIFHSRYNLLVCEQEHEFKCSGPVERTGSECSAEPQCPHPCRCADGIVDCRENSLTKVPTHLPEDTTELFVLLCHKPPRRICQISLIYETLCYKRYDDN